MGMGQGRRKKKGKGKKDEHPVLGNVFRQGGNGNGYTQNALHFEENK